MTEELPAEMPEDVPVAVPGDSSMSAREAARALAQVRWSKPQPEPEPSPLVAEVAVAEAGQVPESAAPETDPGVTPTETPEPAEELPPIEPPRSWSREWKEEFQNYPREAQEKIVAREQERETALRRGQNEAAEQRKAIDAERNQMEQARKQYEETLPVLLTMLERLQSGDFADIKSPADVERLAREDWPRYAQWDAHQKKVQAIQGEIRAGQERQQQEYSAKWTKFASDEDAKFVERFPEMADKDTATKVANSSISYLKDTGFSDDDLNRLWNGQASVSLRDHRIQSLIRDAVRYREAKAAVPKAVAKPVPKVQKPGSPALRAPDADAAERAAFNRLDETKGIAALRNAANIISQRRATRQ